MLSGETVAGQYPVEAVQTMFNIATRTEESLNYKEILSKRRDQVGMTITDAIGQSVAHTAINLSAATIVTPTESGHTARMIAKYRPQAPIVAVTVNESVSRKLGLVFGVFPASGQNANSTDEMLEDAVQKSLDSGIVKRGDLIVITAGSVGESGTTNLMKVHTVGAVIAKGQGIGRKSAFGPVVVAKNAKEAEQKMTDGAVLVASSTDRDMIASLEKASALITEEGGLTSHAAVVGLSLGIPVIVGLENATSDLTEGQVITVDGARGAVYEGRASVL